MKLICLLVTLLFSGQVSAATLVPTEELESFFQTHGISYQKYDNHTGYANSPVDEDAYVFLPYDDPSEYPEGTDQTLGLFFEFWLGQGLTLDPNMMHLAAGIRGPAPWPEPKEDPETFNEHVVKGRGIAIGQLWTHPGCRLDPEAPWPYPWRGMFIEDFSAKWTPMDIHATDCKPIYMPDNTVYRVDIHVSRLNATVAVWAKTIEPPLWGWNYEFVGALSCISASGTWCPQHTRDEPFGNGFILVGATLLGHPWAVFNIYMAHWDS